MFLIRDKDTLEFGMENAEFGIEEGNVIDLILSLIAFNAQSLSRGSQPVTRNAQLETLNPYLS